MVGFNRRYGAGNRKIRETVESGKVGTPELCLITSRDPAPPPTATITPQPHSGRSGVLS